MQEGVIICALCVICVLCFVIRTVVTKGLVS